MPCDVHSFLNHIQLQLRSKAGIAASGIYPSILLCPPLPSPSPRCTNISSSERPQPNCISHRIFPNFFLFFSKQTKTASSLLPGTSCCLSCRSYLPQIMLYRTQSLIMFLSCKHKRHPGSKRIDLSGEF